jgi:hypothetical protein
MENACGIERLYDDDGVTWNEVTHKMTIKTFHSLAALAARFDGVVFQSIEGDALFVHDRMRSTWYAYRWTKGQREIVFVRQVEDELPIMIQVYPAL